VSDAELIRTAQTVGWSAVTAALVVWALGEWGVLLVLAVLGAMVLGVARMVGDRRTVALGFVALVVLLVGNVSLARADTASWYGDEGGPIACGTGTIPAGSIHVAHRTLPCGTRVVVDRGGRRYQARVADRGPYVPGREWDLSRRLMRLLGGIDEGVIEVHVVVQRVPRCLPRRFGRAYGGLPPC